MEAFSKFDELLTGQEVSQILKVSIHTVNWWRSQGKGPRFVKLGTGLSSPVRYRLSDLQAYLVSRKVSLPEQEADHVG